MRAVRAILDFLYLARYPAHTSITVGLLRDALQRFHANKQFFIDLDIRSNWRLPKLHSLDHYLLSIKLFGTTDNYDTQYTERLHIDFAKDAYRATNHKDEFPQMTLWLERREKVQRHAAYIAWRLGHLTFAAAACTAFLEDAHDVDMDSSSRHSSDVALPSQPPSAPSPPSPLPHDPDIPTLSIIKIAKWPNVKGLRFETATRKYGTTFLRGALARFIVSYRDATLSTAEIERESVNVSFPFRSVPAFHKLKITLEDVQDLGIMEELKDVVHVRPERTDSHNRMVPGRFDTVLVNDGTSGPVGIDGRLES